MVKFIFILILIAVVLNRLSYKYSLDKLYYNRKLSKTLVESGENFQLTTVLENRKIFPVTFVRICEKLPKKFSYKSTSNVLESGEGVFHTSTMSVMPYQRIRRTYDISCSSRGRYAIEEVSITAGDILGVKTSSRDVSFRQEVIVLPKRYDINEKIVPYGSYNGDISVKRWIIEDPVLTIGIREYTGGEPQKWIHWPSSLKTGRLMVKEFDYTSDNKGMIVLNIESCKPFWMNINQDTIENCISIARSIAEDFEDNNIPYGFMNNGQMVGEAKGGTAYNYIYPGVGELQLSYVIECLGRIDYSIFMTFEEMIDKILNMDTSFTTVVLITPCILNTYVEYINRLNKKVDRLVVISINRDFADKLDEGILTYVEGGGK